MADETVCPTIATIAATVIATTGLLFAYCKVWQAFSLPLEFLHFGKTLQSTEALLFAYCKVGQAFSLPLEFLHFAETLRATEALLFAYCKVGQAFSLPSFPHACAFRRSSCRRRIHATVNRLGTPRSGICGEANPTDGRQGLRFPCVFAGRGQSPGVVLLRFHSSARALIGPSISALVREHGQKLVGAFTVLQARYRSNHTTFTKDIDLDLPAGYLLARSPNRDVEKLCVFRQIDIPRHEVEFHRLIAGNVISWQALSPGSRRIRKLA
jgi:hypothetical protein